MQERPSMEPGDWFQAAINGVIGVFLGIATHGLVQLVAIGAWWMALILVVLGVGYFFFVQLADKLFDWIFPSGIRTVGKRRGQPKPLLRVLSLPAGLLVGIALAGLGLDTVLLDALP
jgi:hypothetical protein